MPDGAGSELLDQDNAVAFYIPGQYRNRVTSLKELSSNTVRPRTVKLTMPQGQRVHPKITVKNRFSVSYLDICCAVGQRKISQNLRSVLQFTGRA